MEYKIGEVSKILNISKEMIRYYEKQGILKPARIGVNNYRTYSVMDVFLLMEIIRYQSIHFGIKDISELLNEHYLENYAQHLYQYYQEIDQDIIKKILLKERVKELAERSETCKFNLGKGDDYDKLQISIENRNLLFSKERMVYVESMVLFEKEKETWWYGMEERYIESLQLSFKDEKYLKKQLCLCTMIDMGEIGCFNRNQLENILNEIKDEYQIVGTPRGIIVGRGYEGENFQRIMEIQIPIALKH